MYFNNMLCLKSLQMIDADDFIFVEPTVPFLGNFLCIVFCLL